MPTRRSIKKKTNILETLTTNRTVGLEIEGYMRKSPNDVTIRNCQKKRDGSLANGNWGRTLARGRYGVEIVTQPMTDLSELYGIFKDITDADWRTSSAAGLHIHVDVSDFTLADKLKAGYFGSMVQDIMFLFVKTSRFRNHYCEHLQTTNLWATYAKAPELAEARNLYNLREMIAINSRIPGALSTSRYRWMNIFGTHYPTIEFRIFNSIGNADDGIKFAYLVHNMIDIIKNSTIEHLEFIANAIDAETTIERKARKFLNAMNIPYEMDIVNIRAYEVLETQIAAKQRAQQQTAIV